ncbi:hypothetical protein [Pedobacter sp. SYP-B3415]|uniref:hypothetical protein n=1 Tax=Pedobacter sp. SYP-B3415 TaxID=2496641 RepID=UPI00101E1904|nr:hypothetical protein [Pedobacter sp. SYP-B3415]
MSNFNPDSELIREFFERLADNIRNESIAQGRVATGRTIDSIQTLITTSIGAQLRADANIIRTEYGTSPKEAQEQSYSSLVDALIEWMAAKGLRLNPYALAHSLRKRGSRLYQQGGQSGVLSNFIREDNINDFSEKLATKYLRETASLLFP